MRSQLANDQQVISTLNQQVATLDQTVQLLSRQVQEAKSYNDSTCKKQLQDASVVISGLTSRLTELGAEYQREI